MRTLSWTVIGALLGVAACGAAAEFACSGDADCVLSSTPGICTDGGHCAYPDEECGSGYAYPAQTPGMGGECVPGDTPMTGTAGDDDDDDDDDAVGGTGTSSGSDSSGRVDGGSSGDAGSTGDVSTSSASTSGSDSTGSGLCVDEIGDEPNDAEPVAGCQGAAASQIVDADDVDWWAIGKACQSADYLVDLEGPVEDEVEVCLLISCGGEVPMVNCVDGVPSTVLGLVGCCDQTGEAGGAYECADNGAELFVSVKPISTFECEEYDFTVEIL